MYWKAASVFFWCAGIFFLIECATQYYRKRWLILSVISGVLSAVCCLVIPITGMIGMLLALSCGWVLFLLVGLLIHKDRIRFIFECLISAQLCILLLPIARLEQTNAAWEYIFYATIALLAALSPLFLSSSNQLSRRTAVRISKLLPWSLLFPVAGLVWQSIILLLIRGKSLDVLLLGTLTVFPIPAVCFLGFVVIAELIDSKKREKEMSRWQKESRDYMNVIRSQRHDYNVHLHAVVGLIENGEYEGCRHYLEKMVGDATDINDIMPVSDAVVGSMLHNMRMEARKRGSDITYNITYDLADILCNSFECNKIIGNLLQNALDALTTQTARDRRIHLSIFKRRGNTVITVENYFDGDKNLIMRAFEPGYSTKKHHEGIGLSMVLRTVEGYGGRIYPEFDDDMIRFVVNIPNKVNLSEEGGK